MPNTPENAGAAISNQVTTVEGTNGTWQNHYLSGVTPETELYIVHNEADLTDGLAVHHTGLELGSEHFYLHVLSTAVVDDAGLQLMSHTTQTLHGDMYVYRQNGDVTLMNAMPPDNIIFH